METGRFELLEDVATQQRKSYGQETRWLKPSPIIVRWTGAGDEVSGTVTASLVACDVPEAAAAPICRDSLGGERTVPLVGGVSSFFLKMSDRTDAFVRLRFDVTYACSGDGPGRQRAATVFSAPFKVDSNRPRGMAANATQLTAEEAASAESLLCPQLLDVMPATASPGAVVQILGKRFAAAAATRCEVNGVAAEVLEASPSIIRVRVPQTLPPGSFLLRVGSAVGNTVVWGATSLLFTLTKAIERDANGSTLLMRLAGEGNAGEAAIMLQGCGMAELANLVGATNAIGDSALHYACAGGHAAVVSLLLSCGAPASQANNDGETPLHYAALSGNKAIVSDLLAHCARVDARSTGGFTPLHNAAWRHHAEVVMALLEAHADPVARTADGHTPLHLAELSLESAGAAEECVQLLRRFG